MTESSETPRAGVGTSPADEDHTGDTAAPDDATLGGIGDDQLPEDLRPSDDNPLAVPLDPEDEATRSREELEMDATHEGLDAERTVEDESEKVADADPHGDDSDEADADS